MEKIIKNNKATDIGKIFKFNTTNSKTSFWLFASKSILRKWYYSIPTFLFSTVIVVSLVANIGIIGKITALLISQNFTDLITNSKSLTKILLASGISNPNDFDSDYSQILNTLSAHPLSAENLAFLIHKFYYSFIIVEKSRITGDFTLSAPFSLFGINLAFDVFQYCLFIAINLLIVIFATYFTYLFAGLLADSEKTRYKNIVIYKLIDQDIHYINHSKISVLINTVIQDTDTYAKHLKMAPVLFYQAILTFGLSLYTMISIDTWMTLVVIGIFGCIIVIVGVTMLLKKYINNKVAEIKKKSDNFISERLNSMFLIKSSGTWRSETNHLKIENNTTEKRIRNSLALTELISAAIIGGIGTFVMISIVSGIFKYIDDIKTLLSVMTSFTTGSLVIALPILQINAIIPEMEKSKYATRQINNVLKSKKIVLYEGTIPFKTLKKTIDINNIDFAFPDAPNINYLENITIKFEKYKKYAFIGGTGSGKSTISKLLLRFYDPTKGNIEVDGIDLKNYELTSWLNKIGYVEQEPQILSGSFIENLKYSKPDATNEEIVEACKKAKIHDYIMSLTDQYNTVLFERGAQLSGGQKQRLVIARMFIKDPEILILDEATSALDNVIEAEIQEEFEKLMVGRTTITIAHRLNTIKNADEIFVLAHRHGIIQHGTFKELSNVEGKFKELLGIQEKS